MTVFRLLKNSKEHVVDEMRPTVNVMTDGAIILKCCVSANVSVTHSVLIGFGLAELTGGYRIS